MNYENLSDRELDALSWEKIAGQRRAERNRNAPVVWEPTQDVGQVFEVVEAMRERGFGVSINDNQVEGLWIVDFGKDDLVRAESPSLPRAIVIAALRACA